MTLSVEPGCFLRKGDQDWDGLVIYSCKHRVVRWRCKVQAIGTAVELDFSQTSVKALTYDTVRNPAEWKAIDCDLFTPCEIVPGIDREAEACHVLLVIRGQDITKRAFRRGSLLMTAVFLDNFYSELKAKGKTIPRGDGPLVKCIGKHVMQGEYTEEMSTSL